jgi:penicillin-binding protein 1A
MLAGLPKAPSKHHPISNPKRAEARRNYVLQRLLENQWISQEEYKLAYAAPITAKRQKSRVEVNAPYVAEMVRLKVLENFGKQAYWQGLNIFTSIKKETQEAANSALRKNLLAYDKRHGYRGILKSLSKVPNEQWLSELLDIQPSGNIIPAVVLKTSKEKVTLLNRNDETVSINLNNNTWARKYISADNIGSKPSNFSKLFKKADVLFIEPITFQETPAREQRQWRLSQLPQVQGAIVSTKAMTGEIIALAGGFDFYFNNYNRVTQARRQPGSSLKPFIYSAAIDKGYQPATKINGSPIVIKDAAQGTLWRPHNYSNKIYPPTQMRVALAKSMNLVSIRLLRAIGVDYGREYISRFGIPKDYLANSLSLALGSGNATPLEVNTAYVALANTGYLLAPSFINRIESPDGSIIYKNVAQKFCESCTSPRISDSEISDNNSELKKFAPRIMPKGTNFIINDMLRDVVRYGTARKAQILERDDLAGKTGTTNDYIDAWFNGYGGNLVTTTWVGFDTPQTLGRGEAGGRAALPMWIDFMKVALKEQPIREYQKPLDVIELVDDQTEKVDYQLVNSEQINTFLIEKPISAAATSPDNTLQPKAKIEDLF